jgi:hypothetical protein
MIHVVWLGNYKKHMGKRGLINKKSECVFGNNEKELLPSEDVYVSGVDKCKYLEVLFSKNGNGNEINNGVNNGRNIIRSLNSILQDKSLRKITRKRIYYTLVQSVTIYGVEVWRVSRKNRSKLLATKMDYL